MSTSPLAFLDCLTLAGIPYRIPKHLMPLAHLLAELSYDPQAIRNAVRDIDHGVPVEEVAYLDPEDVEAVRELLEAPKV